jgi:hypothetical protein
MEYFQLVAMFIWHDQMVLRHEFGNPKELSSITVKRRGNTTESVSDGKITLTNEVIRI